MAKYSSKRRPLSCELQLSVIEEEELQSLRRRGQWTSSEKQKSRRSKSESDGDVCDRSDVSGDENGIVSASRRSDSRVDVEFGAIGKSKGDEDYFGRLDQSWETASLGGELRIERENSVSGAYRQLPFDNEDSNCNHVIGPHNAVLRKAASLDYIKPKGNKYLRLAKPFFSRVASNLKQAVSEKDLLKLTDLPVASGIPARPRSASDDERCALVSNLGTWDVLVTCRPPS